MKRIALAVALLIAGLTSALAQGTVTRIGPITNGDCASFSSPNTIQDGGIPCGAGHFANPTGAVGLAVVNGVATTAMRSDAAPPLSASVQSALTAAANQLLVGTGAFGFSAIGAPTRAGDIAYYNGSTWVMLAGNNSGTQILSENASGVPAWSSAGAGTVTTAGNGLTLSGGGTTLGITAPVSIANGGTGAIVAPARSTGTFGNMAGTTSIPPVMNGLAGSITPATSGKIYVSMFGIANNNTANDGCAWTVRVGTGGAPANGAAATGTSLSPNLGTMTSSSAVLQLPFPAIGYTTTPLIVGTTYWIDLAFNAVTGGTCTLSTIGMVAIEE